MRENKDFHHHSQLWFLYQNDDCSIAVPTRAVRNSMGCLSTLRGKYDAMKHNSLQSVNLSCVFVLSCGLQGGLCPYCPFC